MKIGQFPLTNCLSFIELYENLRECREGFNSLSFGHFLVFFPRNPEEIKIILNSSETFEKPFLYKFFHSCGLLVIGGEKYKQQRKALNPLFYPGNLKVFHSILNQKTSEFIENFERDFGLKNVDIKNAAFHFTANSILSTIFGAESGSFEHIQEIIDSFDE